MPPIVGMGYQGLTTNALISRLQAGEFRVVVDVRLNAISRKPGFSKRQLTTALSAAGIRYVHLPALGNPRENRPGYAEIGSAAALTARTRFRSALREDASSRQLAELVDLAQSGRTAVLCYEEDERHCHREQVIEAAKRLAN